MAKSIRSSFRKQSEQVNTAPTPTSELGPPMSNSERIALCINSNVNTDAGHSFSDGHAWLTLEKDNTIDGYGLYPDQHSGIREAGLDNGVGSDLRHNFQNDKRPGKYQYCEDINKTQFEQFESIQQDPAHWSETHNCSSWASETFFDITETDVDADDEWVLGVETPRELGQNITRLNEQRALQGGR